MGFGKLAEAGLLLANLNSQPALTPEAVRLEQTPITIEQPCETNTAKQQLQAMLVEAQSRYGTKNGQEYSDTCQNLGDGFYMQGVSAKRGNGSESGFIVLFNDENTPLLRNIANIDPDGETRNQFQILSHAGEAARELLVGCGTEAPRRIEFPFDPSNKSVFSQVYTCRTDQQFYAKPPTE
jgi:hypothetical protein